MREVSTITKLIVVFDAVASAQCPKSLNQCQYGATLPQPTPYSLLVWFCSHKRGVMTDMERLLCQIEITLDKRNWQHILWREDESAPVNHYQLATVTYRHTSALFLAIRCLQQIKGNLSQRAQNVLRKFILELYVDDLLSGADSEHKAKGKLSRILNVLNLY
jgi:glutamine synthetase adenylyltransferase